MVPSDIMEHCRLCLVKESVSINIFENENEIRQLYYKIVACLPVQISKQEARLPRKICTTCNIKVDELYNFWSLTANSQKTLLRWIDEAEDTTLTKIKCEFDADLPNKIEPHDNSSDDGNHKDDTFEDEPYRDESDVPEDDLVPTNMVNVSMHDEMLDIKPKKSSSGTKKRSAEFKNKKSRSSTPKKVKVRVKEEKMTYSKPAMTASDIEEQKQQCPYCNKELANSTKYAHHIKMNHSFHCKPCDSMFHYKKDRNAHRILNPSCSEQEEAPERFCCSQCDYTVTIKKNLELHIKKKHTAEVNILCPECGQGFFNVKELESHKIEKHGADPFVCVPCNKQFSKIENLRLHQRRYHSDTVNKECKICHKVLRTARLSEHMKQVHLATVHECPLCGKNVVTDKNYKKHMQLHSDEKPFECQYCRKAFKLKYYLTLHLRTHTGVRPMFECDICHKVLPTDCRIKHMASHNVSKTSLCSVCGAGFVNDVGLKVHMRRHQ